MGKVYSAKDFLASKFGDEGTSEREIFNADSFKYYFGEIVKSRRQELKITQEQLALKIGKKRTYISRIENGEDIVMSNFYLIANALDLNIRITSV